MLATLQIGNCVYQTNFAQPIDIAIALCEGMETVNCFWAPPLHIEPVRAGNFVGDTKQGGVVNFKNVFFNPHGNGTHTECVGHIAKETYTLNQCLNEYLVLGQLITVYPQQTETGDRVIMPEQLTQAWQNTPDCRALIIRTMPNDALKTRTNYSGSNPPYLQHQAAQWLVEVGIDHLLIDLPSVDREEDEGKLSAHHAFWQYPFATRTHATITELIYVRPNVKDGLYLVNLLTTSLELDASPSKPILYKVVVVE